MESLPNSGKTIKAELFRLQTLFHSGQITHIVAYASEIESEIFNPSVEFRLNEKVYYFREWAAVDFRDSKVVLQMQGGSYIDFTFKELKNFELWKAN